MSMLTGGRKGQVAEINVTPMIDVLLVLLIIFMVVAPVAPRGLNTLVPQPAATGGAERPEDIVVSIARDGSIRVNQEAVESGALGGRFKRIFETRGSALVFVRGDQDLNFHSVAEVIDLARGAGLDRVALATSL